MTAKKPKAKAAGKPAGKPATKPATKSATKPAAKSAAKPEPAAKPAAKPEPAAKSATKPEPSAKPSAKPELGQARKVAFVLGGGGVLGAHEVGMLQALAEAGVRPDLIVGTSVGAINGVFAAAYPQGVDKLADVWRTGGVMSVFDGSLASRVRTFVRSGTHVQGNEGLGGLLNDLLPVSRIEDLEVPFQCVAASIERAAARWFCDGPIIPAVLASSAVPGLLPAVQIDGEHFLDGGLVHSIPVGRAIAQGATEIYVLHVGRIERPLAVPRRPWQVGMVAFEIARRHRFFEEMASVPSDVAVHVLPAGAEGPTQRGDLSPLRYRDTSRIDVHIQRAYAASRSYLEHAA